ncbi:lytic murein transglycosylase B [Massilia sp. TS11]|uniref:lytic murein transglycosylase B n=1 Tax=Massilia sp. TS11 TaxID=2908003 RepID=UPI001EDA172E|nr:lytic murein transglycosylase B [Massilia sp. TS11]MCG2585573.1 lytic murein transglycosylase B [Massilia sp. TS11]
MPMNTIRRLALLVLLALPLLATAAPPKKTHKAKPKAHAAALKKSGTDYVGEAVNFPGWQSVAAFEDEMVARHGFTRAELDALFAQVRLVDAAAQLIKPAPPGKPKNWQAYRALMVSPSRIAAGVSFWNTHAATLARAEAEFGVPAEIIVGILGVETLYGQNTGRFRVMDALTTLAFAYPEAPNRAARMDFFRAELESTLLFARQHQLDPLSLLGSYAGAVGLPQFMPGNILRYALDYDQDGQIDLRNSPADAIGSVARFLVAHGWQGAEAAPYVYAAQVSPARQWEGLIGRGLVAEYALAQLAEAGVTPAAGTPPARLYGLVDLQNGAEPSEYWLASHNFFAITQYNRSYFYAMAVIALGEAVRSARP